MEHNSRQGIVLLSGGLDSSVSLALALKRGLRVKLALIFDYGQKAARQEIKAGRAIARFYNVRLRIIKIKWLGEVAWQSGLIKGRLKKIRPNDLVDSRKMYNIAKAVWVPNRNALFINIAAAFAETLKYPYIITGFNREEARTFPDNSTGFVKAINKTLRFSTLSKVKVVSYTSKMTKPQIYKQGLRLNVPLDDTWSCYRGTRKPCGYCESCCRRKKAEGR